MDDLSASLKGRASIEIEGLTIAYGRQQAPAVEGFGLSIPPGGFGVLLGHSGSGKSTVLNACAGLIEPTAGRITIGGKTLFDAERGVNAPPNRRDLGMVFQSYALWPHLTVRANVEYPLRRRKVKGTALNTRVNEALELVQCEQFADRHPGQLSGGQQQRVALARAIVSEPAVLLFDEPLSNLDAELRRQLREEIGALHQRVGFTALYVTHDQSEALGLGTTVTIMKGGRLVQSGVPREVYSAPHSVTTALYFGANVWRISKGGRSEVDTPIGPLDVSGIAADALDVAVYPQAIELIPDEEGHGTVVTGRFLGNTSEYLVEVGDEMVRVSGPPQGYGAPAGTRVRLNARPELRFLFAATSAAVAIEEESELASSN
jgi:iron(III) transport system ATP-binding protein